MKGDGRPRCRPSASDFSARETAKGVAGHETGATAQKRWVHPKPSSRSNSARMKEKRTLVLSLLDSVLVEVASGVLVLEDHDLGPIELTAADRKLGLLGESGLPAARLQHDEQLDATECDRARVRESRESTKGEGLVFLRASRGGGVGEGKTLPPADFKLRPEACLPFPLRTRAPSRSDRFPPSFLSQCSPAPDIV